MVHDLQRTRLVFAVVVFLSIVAAWRPVAAEERTGSISGIVVHASTGTPIAGAYVGIGDFGDAGGSNLERFRNQGHYAHTETDEEGRFRLTDVALGEHPLVVTHPKFVRHDQTVVAKQDSAQSPHRIQLTPAATIQVTVVDADGNHLPWLYFRIRLEALDGHAFLPPDKQRHLSTFASPVWTARADKGIFTFTELVPGEYSIDVMDVRSTKMNYHGQLARVEVDSGETKEVVVKPTEYDTCVIVEIPSPRDKRPEMGRSMLAISRNPGLALWADGKVHHPEDPRLGRIVSRALVWGRVSPTDYQVKNLPPGTYSFFAGPGVCLMGAKVEVVAGEEITADIFWTPPKPDQVAIVMLSRLDGRIRLDAEEYTAKRLCELLSEQTESRPRFAADPSIEDAKVPCPSGETVMWDVLEAVCLATGWRLDEQGKDAMILRPAAEPPPTCSLVGRVIDADGAPVAGACVFPCRQDTGAPLAKRFTQTWTEAFLAGSRSMEIAFAVTDSQGRFTFDGIPPDTYRLLAQSWKDAKPVKGLLEVNGVEVVVHGVTEHVVITADTSPEVTIRPLGTGVLSLDEQVGNDETLLMISTEPPRADPILGFAGWGGPFLQNMIGGNRMPHGKTIVHGLPEGTVYVAVFAADNVPGFGVAEADIKPHATTHAYAPLVAGWSNGHHDPPPQLASLFEEVESLIRDRGVSVQHVLESHDIRLKQGDPWQAYEEISQHLSKEIELPTGRKTTFADFLAAARYVELQQQVEQRKQRALRGRQLKQFEESLPSAAKQGTYADTFLELYRELGENYPCLELKGIDWKAVGEELLPRVQQVKTDEQFGMLVMELVARLEDSHAYVGKGTLTPPTPPFPRWDPGFACLLDDRGKPVVYYVDKNGPAEAAEVQVGMTVLSVNGKPADQVMDECMKQARRYQGYSSRRYLQYQAARWFVRQKERGETVSLQMQAVDGSIRPFQLPASMDVRYLPRLSVPMAGISDSANVSWKMLGRDIGYIYVRRIRGELIDRLDRAVEDLKDATGLIVDVRGNSGGGFDAARSHRNFALDDEEPDRPRFDGPMALLIDGRCISAGEGWASWFIANKRARVFGQATAGASSRKTNYSLKNGAYRVTFPVKAYRGFLDRPIERRGLEPDVPVTQTAADLELGRDTVLEAAREYLLDPTPTE